DAARRRVPRGRHRIRPQGRRHGRGPDRRGDLIMKTLTIWLWPCAALALALPAALLLVGCAKDSSCGPGERFKSGMCLPAGSGQKATTPEPEADAGGDGAPVSSGKTAAFGDVCKTNDD